MTDVLRPTILELLSDKAVAPMPARNISRRDIVSAMNDRLRSHVKVLLTSRSCPILPEDRTGLERSLVYFGLRDHSIDNFDTGGRVEKFIAAIKSAIKDFDPRVASVFVTHVNAAEKQALTMNFKIEVRVQIDQKMETFEIKSDVDLSRPTVNVQET